MNLRNFFRCVLFAFCVFYAGLLLAQEVEKTERQTPFRRVFVPESMVNTLPTQGKPYWPVSASEFEAWAESQLFSSNFRDSTRPAIHLCEATYRAKMDSSGKFLIGSAKMSFEDPRSSESSSSVQFWTFPAVSFAVEFPFGFQCENSIAQDVPEMRRARFYNGGGGEIEFLPTDFASGRATLECQWSQIVQNVEGGNVQFEMVLFPASDIVLELTLPESWTPSCTLGLAELLSENPENAEKTWRFRLGGHHRATLQIRSAEVRNVETAPIRVSEKSRYVFERRGLELSCEFTLDTKPRERQNLENRIQRVRARLDGSLLVTDAAFNSLPVRWRYEVVDSEREVVFELPYAVYGFNNLLTVHAIQNPNLQETSDVPKLLPLPRVKIQDAVWVEGQTTLEVADPLELVDMKLAEAGILRRQTATEPETFAPTSFRSTVYDLDSHLQSRKQNRVKSWIIQETSERSEIEIALCRRESKVNVDICTALDFQENEILAVTQLDASLDGNECFELWGLVDRSWTIDSIESSEPGLVDDWNLDAAPKDLFGLLAGENVNSELLAGWDTSNLGVLRIQLAHSVRRNHPISLRIRSRRLEFPHSFTFTGAQLTPVCFPEYAVGESWILCGTSFSWALRFLEPYHPVDVFLESDISAAGTEDGTENETHSASLFNTLTLARSQFPERMTFLAGHQDFRNRPMLQVEPSSKNYRAQVEGFYDLTVTPQAIYRIKCDPRGGEVKRLRVVVCPGSFLGTSWRFPRALNGSTARCVERKTNRDADGIEFSSEWWEISFRQPQRDPFEIELILLTDTTLLPEFSQASEGSGVALPHSAHPTLDREQLRVLWTTTFPNGIYLPLVSLPDAQNCTGLVTLRSEVSNDVYIESRNMAPLLDVAWGGMDSERNHGVTNSAEYIRHYRYTPSTGPGTLSQRLKIRWRGTPASRFKAWIWDESCQSQFFTSGKTLHVTTFRVENIGEEQFDVRIRSGNEENFRFLGAIVNGQRIANPKIETLESDEQGGVTRKISLPLPIWKRNSTVILQWLEDDDPLGVTSTLDPPRVQTDFLVLQTTWKAWLPESYIPLNHFSVNTHWNLLRNDSGADIDEKAAVRSRDSVLLRIFGNFQVGRNIFIPKREVAPGSMSPLALEDGQAPTAGWASIINESEPLSLAAIFQDELSPDRVSGWNLCTQKNLKPLLVVQGNALEASRWFFMLLTFLLTAWWFERYRPARVGLCGISAAVCLLVPLVWTPVFSGIFLGFLLSFGFHSIKRHLRRRETISQTIIRIFGGKST